MEPDGPNLYAVFEGRFEIKKIEKDEQIHVI